MVGQRAPNCEGLSRATSGEGKHSVHIARAPTHLAALSAPVALVLVPAGQATHSPRGDDALPPSE